MKTEFDPPFTPSPGEAIVNRRLLFNLHNYLVHDAGYMHALSNDYNQDEVTRQHARDISRRNIWIATELALQCGFPTMNVGPDLWVRRV